MLISWLIKNWVEVAGALTGLVAVYFQIKEKIIFWPISLINVLLYIYVYFTFRLYAEVSLQLYYFVVSIYGWYYWVAGKNNINKNVTAKVLSFGEDLGEVNPTLTTNNNSKELPITTCSNKLIVILSLIFIATFLLMAYVLYNYTNTDVPFIDAFVTSLSFVATWLLAKKKLENWLIWIFVDAVSVGVYIYKGLYATIVLFAVLTILAVIGYNSWKKNLKTKEIPVNN